MPEELEISSLPTLTTKLAAGIIPVTQSGTTSKITFKDMLKGQFGVIVAANDSNAETKAVAEFVCDGTSDQIQIQAANDTLTKGGLLWLSEGDFDMAAGVLYNKDVTIAGFGSNQTTLTASYTTDLSMFAPKTHASSGSGFTPADGLLNDWHFNVKDLNIIQPAGQANGVGIDYAGVGLGFITGVKINDGRIGIRLRGESNANGGFTMQNRILYNFTHNCGIGLSVGEDAAGRGAPENIVFGNFFLERSENPPPNKGEEKWIGIAYEFASRTRIIQNKFQGFATCIQVDFVTTGKPPAPEFHDNLMEGAAKGFDFKNTLDSPYKVILQGEGGFADVDINFTRANNIDIAGSGSFNIPVLAVGGTITTPTFSPTTSYTTLDENLESIIATGNGQHPTIRWKIAVTGKGSDNGAGLKGVEVFRAGAVGDGSQVEWAGDTVDARLADDWNYQPLNESGSQMKFGIKMKGAVGGETLTLSQIHVIVERA